MTTALSVAMKKKRAKAKRQPPGGRRKPVVKKPPVARARARAAPSRTRGAEIVRVVTRSRRALPKERFDRLHFRCTVSAIDEQAEVVFLIEPVMERCFAMPIPTKDGSGKAIRDVGLKPGQRVWLSLKATT